MDANLIEIIVILVVAGLAGLGKLLGAMQQAQQREIVRQKALQQAGQPVRGEAANAADEIEEFMRRAAEERAAKRAAAKQRAARQQISGGIERPVQRRPKPRPAEKPVQAEVVGEKPAGKPAGGQVAKHVDKYFDVDKFGQRTHHLGEETAQTDRQIDQHLHQVFDHQVSSLAAAQSEASKPPEAVEYSDLSGEPVLDEIPATFATVLTDLLSDPESVRQAIVFNEILRRPEERWG